MFEWFHLTNEKEFAIFGQRPHFVVDHKFEFVDVAADNFHWRHHIIVVSNCFFALAVDAVSVLASINHAVGFRLDNFEVSADFLDGFAARLLHAYSNLGKELDSLCDLVSFGVAPAVMMFFAMSEYGAQEWSRWLVFLIPVCGALRLARFNIDDRQTTSFIGLPIPANAIFWIGYSALLPQYVGFMTQWYFFTAVVLLESWLMVSPMRFFSLKFKTWGWQGNQWRWLMIVSAVVLIFCMGVPGLLWTMVVYILYSLIDARKG